jgi:hypothetical protein
LLRIVARFFGAVLIGVGATLAWQSYGNEAKEMVRTWAPSLAGLLPASTMESIPPAATLPEVTQQLQPVSLDLAIVRRSLDLLAAKQDKMAQDIATLQAVEQDTTRRRACFGVHSGSTQANGNGRKSTLNSMAKRVQCKSCHSGQLSQNYKHYGA